MSTLLSSSFFSHPTSSYQNYFLTNAENEKNFYKSSEVEDYDLEILSADFYQNLEDFDPSLYIDDQQAWSLDDEDELSSLAVSLQNTLLLQKQRKRPKRPRRGICAIFAFVKGIISKTVHRPDQKARASLHTRGRKDVSENSNVRCVSVSG
ncbi:hypothetical protein OS493_013520 [Desmophyllum pertusum]|uniref:Uncharacterized protein n=1 Tax=Desmophyllum pertusum TaxID=174260 RepID=A0A9X0A2A3_9CNID|nr:hypothetical protein OS493_013520 [Desmophyllum pertusum]